LQDELQDLRILSQLQRFLLKSLPPVRLPLEKSDFQYCELNSNHGIAVLTLVSADGTNKLGREVIEELLQCVIMLRSQAEQDQLQRLVITGNQKFFSAGADLNQIAQLTGPAAFEFSKLGQKLTAAVDHFPALVIAAIRGYCMGGGMDLALACHARIASPDAVFGHRGASLGLMTGWGGTQRLPRLVGKSRALQMFLLAEMVQAAEAKRVGLIDQIAADPISVAIEMALP
jgi:enoyl-CoA hydratase/carnithine racemase